MARRLGSILGPVRFYFHDDGFYRDVPQEEKTMSEHDHWKDPVHDPILPLIALLRPFLLKIQTGTPAGTTYSAAEISRLLYIATGNMSTNPVPPAAPDPLPDLPGAG